MVPILFLVSREMQGKQIMMDPDKAFVLGDGSGTEFWNLSALPPSPEWLNSL